MKKVYYWSPYIGNIATIKAVINSAFSLSKFSKGSLLPTIINSSGEWDKKAKDLNLKKIELINLQNKFRVNTKINGFFRSRIEYLKIFFFCYLPLRNLIKKNKPEYLIIHLITLLPFIIYFFNKFETKLIVRISGKLKLNFFRKLIWRLSAKNIYKITCPTQQSLQEIVDLKIVDKKKVIFLPDPVINIEEINKKKKEQVNFKLPDKYFLTIGRFTRQKNHKLLINSFENLNNILENIELLILGEGELKDEYTRLIEKFNLQKKIHLIGYKDNIFPLIKNSIGVISPSLWEDPGFVMIEASACGTPVISSDCPSGPKEFLSNGNGILFKNNNQQDLEKKIREFLNLNSFEINKMRLGAKKNSSKFTKFKHFKILHNNLI